MLKNHRKLSLKSQISMNYNRTFICKNESWNASNGGDTSVSMVWIWFECSAKDTDAKKIQILLIQN